MADPPLAAVVKKPGVRSASMAPEEQVDRWARGESVHNTWTGECCPDFSCCNLSVSTPIEVRRRFQDATEEQRHGMLMMFLGAAIDAHYGKSKRVHVAGFGPDR